MRRARWAVAVDFEDSASVDKVAAKNGEYLLGRQVRAAQPKSTQRAAAAAGRASQRAAGATLPLCAAGGGGS